MPTDFYHLSADEQKIAKLISTRLGVAVTDAASGLMPAGLVVNSLIGAEVVAGEGCVDLSFEDGCTKRISVLWFVQHSAHFMAGSFHNFKHTRPSKSKKYR